jgi:signal transduction histidine kinase
MLRKAPMYVVVLFPLAVGLGVMGDLAGCARIRLPTFWISLLTGCHYVAILLASLGFGLEVGLGAAVLVGVAHVTTGLTACGESISQQAEVAAFLVVGLLAGFLVKRRQTNALTQGRVAKADPPARGEIYQNPDTRGGEQMPVGFVRAVRAPLSAIESAGYVLEDSALTDANHQEVASIILRECHRIEVLIRSMEFGQRLPAYRDVDLSSVLDEIVRRGAHLTETASITLRKEEGSDLNTVCDSDFLEQAVLNLLANAIRIAEPGDEIILSAHSDQSSAIIEISSRRIGILGHLGITLAAMPENARHVDLPAVQAPFTPEGGTQ